MIFSPHRRFRTPNVTANLGVDHIIFKPSPRRCSRCTTSPSANHCTRRRTETSKRNLATAASSHQYPALEHGVRYRVPILAGAISVHKFPRNRYMKQNCVQPVTPSAFMEKLALSLGPALHPLPSGERRWLRGDYPESNVYWISASKDSHEILPIGWVKPADTGMS